MDDLRTEDEIISSWHGRLERPLVSISCTTFNHESYIEDALKGFLIQKTDFPFEILIHDDASTDRTADIIHEYHMRYPRIIKPILQMENQYSQGIKPSRFNSSRARGEFLAVCEGDDYWTSPDKLAKQVEGLQEHPDIDLCFHPAIKRDYARNRETEIGKYAVAAQHIVPVEQIIMKTHGLIPTAAVMFRKNILTELKAFRNSQSYLAVGDIYLFFFGARRGGALFINEVMSVYRAHVPGSWTQKNKANYKRRMQNIQVRVRSYHELDKATNQRYGDAFKRDNSRRILGIVKDPQIPYFDKYHFYAENRNFMRASDKIIALPLVFFPGLTTALSVIFRKR